MDNCRLQYNLTYFCNQTSRPQLGNREISISRCVDLDGYVYLLFTLIMLTVMYGSFHKYGFNSFVPAFLPYQEHIIFKVYVLKR